MTFEANNTVKASINVFNFLNRAKKQQNYLAL